MKKPASRKDTRRARVDSTQRPAAGLPKARTGIGEIDEVTHGGLPRDRTTLRERGPGSDKTILASQSLVNGARLADEPVMHESEERFREFFEQVAVGMAHVSPDGLLLRVNDRFCDIVGYAREELVGMPLLEITLAEDRPVSIEMRRALGSGEVPFYALEQRCLRKSGETIWIKLTDTLARPFAGEGAQTIAVVEDITARKRSEARLVRLNGLHVVLSRLGDDAMKSSHRRELYESVCRVMVEQGGLCSAWIVEPSDAPDGWRLAASRGVASEAAGPPDRPLGKFYPGREALRTGDHELYNDFPLDPRTVPWREWGHRHGILAAAAFPIRCGGSVVAAMVVLAGETGYFEEDEIHLMVSAASEVSFLLEAQQQEQQRQATERALRASEAGMAAAQAIAHFGSWELDLSRASPVDLGPMRWSDEMFRIAGLLPGSVEVTTDLFFDLIPLEERAQVQAAIAMAIDRRQGLSIVHRMRQPRGDERIVQQTAQLFLDGETGRILKMVGTTHDITEQRCAQGAIRMQAQMLDQIGQAVITTDPEGYVTYVNRFACELYRCAAESMIGREIIDVTAARYTEEQAREKSARLLAGARWSGECLVQACDGRVFPAFITDSPLLDEQGQLIGIVSISIDIGARKHAQALLEKSEREQRQLATQLEAERAGLVAAQAVAKVGGWEVDLATSAVIWSAEMYRIFQTNPAALAADWRNVLNFVHPEDRAPLGEAFVRSTEQCGTYEFEHRIVLADGRIKVVHQRWQIVPDAQDAPWRAVGTCQDITERKLAEAEVRRTTDLLRAVTYSTSDAVFVKDRQCRFLLANEAAARGVGKTVEEMLGKDEHSMFPADDARRIMEGDRFVMESNQVQTVEENLTFLGANRTMLVTKAPYHDAQGNVIGLVGIARDITDRKRAEERLAEQAALIDGARDAIIVRDLDHRIRYWNKSAGRLYGWRPDEVIGRSVREVLRDDPTVFDSAMRTVLDSGEWVGELLIEDKEGRKLIVESRWTLVRDEAGKPRSVFAIDTDMTERKRLEQQFLRAQRMESIGTLAGGVAHDLNNALTPISMSVNLLKAKFSHPDADNLLEIIGSSAERGADMVRQLLSFARGVDGRKVEVQVKHLLEEIRKMADETFLKHIRVRTHVPDDLWTVTGDPTQIHQVFLNLCVNARDAMPNGGTLLMSAENIEIDAHYAGLNPDVVPGSYVYLSFEDSGTGIPPEVIEKIFDPFFTTKELGKGTGLGLSTSLAIVKSHGGFIRVYSEPGKGTTFKVGLPARIEHDAETRVATASDGLRGNGELILVVDDEVSVREVTRYTLEASGYRAVVAADGAEAVAIYAGRGAEIAVVFTDMMMPEMDGPTSVRILRRINPAVRVIYASGLSGNADAAQHAFLDPKYFLPKPYTADALLTMLKRILADA